MAYGVRLHLEQILLHRANVEFEQFLQVKEELNKLMQKPEQHTGEEFEKIDSLKESSLVHKAMFVMNISIAIESFLNFSLRRKAELDGDNSAATQDRNFEDKLRDRSFNWKEKLKVLFGEHDGTLIYQEIELNKIQGLRNDLIHYKYGIYYQGFDSEDSEIENVLSDSTAVKIESQVATLLSRISNAVEIPEDERGFLDKRYRFFFYDG